MDAQTQMQFNSFPFQKTLAELDWAVFMYIFIVGTVIGSVLLYRIVSCCVEGRSRNEVMV